MIFDLIGRLENYHPRTAHRAHLARVLVLYGLNYIALIFSLFDKLDNIRDAKTIIEDDSNLTAVTKNKRQLFYKKSNKTVIFPYSCNFFRSF